MPRVRSNFGIIGNEKTINSGSTGILSSSIESQYLKSSGKWPGLTTTVNFLVVAGGGGGSGDNTGGGGAGGNAGTGTGGGGGAATGTMVVSLGEAFAVVIGGG